MAIDFRSDVQINHGELEREWLRQSDLYAKYKQLLADANDDLKRAEQRLKIVRSELILKIKETDPKATAQAIEAEYRVNKEHQKAKEEYFRAAYDAEMCDGAVYAILMKKTSLENLVKLHLKNYSATPIISDDVSPEDIRAFQDRQEDVKHATTEKVQERMSGSRRTK